MSVRRKIDLRSSGSPSLLDALVVPAAGAFLVVATVIAAAQVAIGLLRSMREPAWVRVMRDDIDAEAKRAIEDGDLLSHAFRGVTSHTSTVGRA